MFGRNLFGKLHIFRKNIIFLEKELIEIMKFQFFILKTHLAEQYFVAYTLI
jgi:hypothetical protein